MWQRVMQAVASSGGNLSVFRTQIDNSNLAYSSANGFYINLPTEAEGKNIFYVKAYAVQNPTYYSVSFPYDTGQTRYYSGGSTTPAYPTTSQSSNVYLQHAGVDYDNNRIKFFMTINNTAKYYKWNIEVVYGD